MKKFKLTALLLAVVLITGSILPSAVFADTIGKEAKACESLEILIGPDAAQGVTSAYLATTPTRLQALIIFLRIQGLEEQAFKYTGYNNFIDAKDLLWVVGRNYLAYAKDNPELGWIGGADSKFSPNNKIDAKAFYKVMLETLGYKQNLDFTYTDTLKFSEAIGLIISASAMEKQISFTVNDVAKAIYSTLNAKPKGQTKKLVTLMTEKGIISEAKAIAAGFTIDTTPVNVLSFDRISNNKLVLELDKDVSIGKEHINIIAESGSKQITINSVESSGKKLYITTAEVTPFAAYKLSINMDTPVNGMAIKNYSVRYVALPKDTEKPMANAEIISSNIIKLSFSEEIQKSDAENIKNYTIKNDLSIYSARLDSTGKIVTLTTDPQQEGYIYWLTVQNIRDLSGNTMEILEKRFTGMAPDTTKPYIVKMQAESSLSVLITFSETLNRITAERTENYIPESSTLFIEKAALDGTGKVVRLITTAQKPGETYKITVKNIADLVDNVMYTTMESFTGTSGDLTKPTAYAVALTGNEIEVNFNKKMDKQSAENTENYILDNDLKAVKAILDGSGMKVTLITSAQTANKKYKLEVQNITDVNGNAMVYYYTYFIGKPEDTMPLSYTAKGGSESIIITFNKKVDKATAENVFNYVLDSSMGYAAKATLDTDATGKVVTLWTKEQENGKTYSLTVKNVTDMTGKAISSEDRIAKKYFIGLGTSTIGELGLQAVNALDMSTIDLFFDKALTADELDKLQITILAENGGNYTAPAGLSYMKYFSADNSTVRVQFKTNAASNPEIFKYGKVYEVRVTNIERLITANNENVKIFAGTNLANEAPYITGINAMNSTALEVTFSEPVTGISSSQFNISGVIINGASVKSDAVTASVTLYISPNTPLKNNISYRLTVGSGIKDVAGYSSIVTSGSLSYIDFLGTSVVNQAPNVVSINAIDKYTIGITFDEYMKAPVSSGFLLKKTGASTFMPISRAVLSDDMKTIIIYLDSASAGLSSAYSYDLVITTSMTDLQGLEMNSEYRSLQFIGSDVEPPSFELAGQYISADNKTITLITNKPLKNPLLTMDCFEITGAYYTKDNTDSVETSDKTIKITLKNALRSNDVVTIKLTNLGKALIRDMNNLSLIIEEIQLSTN